jgi:hypothetical protein
MKKLLTIAASMAALILSACGGGGSGSFAGSGASGGGGTQTGNGGSTTPTPVYSMGKGSGSAFQAGAIDIAVTSLAAGGTTGMQISIVDQTGTLYSGTSVTINFNSPCFASGQANIVATGTSGGATAAGQVTTSTGIASATYTAKGCSGTDVITATASVGSSTLTATGTVTVASASVGSIQFQTATPAAIGLKGTGLQETSTVVFKVVDSTGGPRPGVTVNFALNTTVGGLNLAPATAVSAADGTVQTVVSSGTQHTSVRVTATIASPALSTQSSVLNVTTGLPAAAGFSIAVGPPSYASAGLACPNVEAYDVDGVTVPITVRLSDRYNNPAPDGTSIAFNTNGGHVGGSCTTPSALNAADGTCQVTWTSANPRPQLADDNPQLRARGRVQVLATTIGEESFTDTNGNGYWDTGEPFTGLGEPYRDDNENSTYDTGEYFLDFNHNGTREAPDTQNFKGITCSGAAPNTTCSTATLAIGIEHLLVMSTSAAQIAVSSTGFSIAHGASQGLTYSVMDGNGNPMAAGTTISVSASGGGSVSGPGASWTIGCRSGLGDTPETLGFTFTAGSTPGPATITITVTSPGTHTSTVAAIPVNQT